MAKLFLPTSSLNFNNIFSIEAISPQSFYAKRNFGYKRFASVLPNPLMNSILLYSKYPKFSIDDPENDNYPMVIELDDSVFLDKLQCVNDSNDVKVYQLAGSVYLNPFSVSIYFDSQQNLQTTIAKSEASIETKLVSLYKHCFNIEHPGLESFLWSEKVILGITDVEFKNSFEEINLDKKIDCIKGFVCSYLIGSNNALSPELIELKQLSKDIKNDFYSLSNLSGDNYATISKSKQKKGDTSSKDFNFRYDGLETKISRFLSLAGIPNSEKRSIPDTEIEVLSKYRFNKTEIEKVLLFLKGYKLDKGTLYDYFQSALGNNSLNENSRTGLRSLHRLLGSLSFKTDSLYSQKLNTVSIDNAIDKLDEIIASFERKYLAQSIKLNFGDAFAIANLKITDYFDSFVKNKTDFYKTLINKFLEVPIDNVEHFKSAKLDLAVIGGKIFKEFAIGWEGSKEQAYINGLLDHIEQYKPFEILSHPSIMLQSFASFIIRGDDPEKLIDFMIDNKVKDFRFSLGLWGSVFGFSAIPRTLTNDFLSNGDVFFIQYYKSIAKQILSYDLDKVEFISGFPKMRSFDSPSDSKSDIEVQPKNFISKKIGYEKEITATSNNNAESNIREPFNCPVCNSKMGKRRDPHKSGDYFWGCDNFFSPEKCPGTRNKDGSDSTRKGREPLQRAKKSTENHSFPEQELNDSDYKELERLIVEFMISKKESHIKISDVLPILNPIIRERIGKIFTTTNIVSLLKQNCFKALKNKKIGNAEGIIHDPKLFSIK